MDTSLRWFGLPACTANPEGQTSITGTAEFVSATFYIASLSFQDALQFGGCDATAANCLPITAGWNYMVRLYRPRPEIQNGEWAFPAAHPAT